MSEKEHRTFENRLAMHAAPTLLGIKCGSLISLSSEEFDINANLELFNKKVNSKGLKIKSLCLCGKRRLIFVYSEKLMNIRLSDSETKLFLRDLGYNEYSVEKCLEKLSERIKTGDEFPHEIGIFLGYPIDDVKGFTENNGEKFKLCGCWKVYGDAEKAEKTFTNYKKCRKFLCDKLNEGVSLYSALRIS